jgi:predicted ATPase
VNVRIEELRIQNFRAFENARLRLGDLTFLVGRNGAGKSSLLDAVEFMRESLSDNLPNALDRRDGLANINRRSRLLNAAPLGLAAIMTTEVAGRDVRLLYGFRVGGLNQGVQEALRVEGKPTLGFERSNGTFTTGVQGISPSVPAGRLALPLVAGEQLWQLVWSTLSQMRGYELVADNIGGAAEIRDRSTLDRDGGNAPNVLHVLHDFPEDIDFVRRFLGGVLSDTREVRAEARSGRRSITVSRAGRDGTEEGFWGKQVSSGTWRALGVLLALRQRPTPPLLLIDEIEDSIHPLAVDALLEAVEQSLPRSRVVVTTHSSEVLRRRQATADRVQLVQWDAGVSSLHRLSEGVRAILDPVTTVGDLLSTNGLAPASAAETFSGDILAW